MYCKLWGRWTIIFPIKRNEVSPHMPTKWSVSTLRGHTAVIIPPCQVAMSVAVRMSTSGWKRLAVPSPFQNQLPTASDSLEADGVSIGHTLWGAET